tara:strand:+ start:413 stop:550 length:138 start_codon:yes stop_codon:yes gene_type:complete
VQVLFAAIQKGIWRLTSDGIEQRAGEILIFAMDLSGMMRKAGGKI